MATMIEQDGVWLKDMLDGRAYDENGNLWVMLEDGTYGKAIDYPEIAKLY